MPPADGPPGPESASAENLRTVLYEAHAALGARMVPFAGYDMPVQYEGVLAEHRWTREHAGLFDVSHMGAGLLSLNRPSGDADADHRALARIVERLVPSDIAGLKPGALRYSMLLNDQGGVRDDLIVGRSESGAEEARLFIVANAGTKDADFALIEAAAGDEATVTRLRGWSLIALQGPEAAAVLQPLLPEARELGFMQWRTLRWEGRPVMVARSGYTGEDGFELTVPDAIAPGVWRRLLDDPLVQPIGLGARDSLRLEAGLPLYGHDLDETVSPVESGMAFVVAKRRREAGDFPGAARILAELSGRPARVRVGLKVKGAPAREGAEIAEPGGAPIGRVTSGGFSPSLSEPIALGFVPPALSAPGTALEVIVRDRRQPATVVPLPFVPHRYVRKP